MEPTIEEILKRARELGIEVEENSSNPGMYIIQEDGSTKKAVFEDIFPEFVIHTHKEVEQLHQQILRYDRDMKYLRDRNAELEKVMIPEYESLETELSETKRVLRMFCSEEDEMRIRNLTKDRQ